MAKIIQCKACSKEIASNAKSCPGCGAKNSKPFYKKIWFWIVAVIIVAGIGGAGSDEPKVVSEGDESTIETSQIQQNNTSKVKTFKIGDVIELNDFRITVNGIRTSNGSQFIKPSEGNEYLYVDATVENISNEEQTVSSVMMFKVVDQDGRAMNQSIVDDANGQLDGTVGAGRKISGEYVVEVPTGATGLELQFDSSLIGNQIIVALN